MPAPLTTSRSTAFARLMLGAAVISILLYTYMIGIPAQGANPFDWRRIWLVLPYPLLWLAVTLLRGATDGWVPYGFLLPDRGPAQLTTTALALLFALLLAAVLTWALSRLPARR